MKLSWRTIRKFAADKYKEAYAQKIKLRAKNEHDETLHTGHQGVKLRKPADGTFDLRVVDKVIEDK